jgi:hypothetical protein
MDRWFAVIVRGSAEIIATPSDATRKKLLVNGPVDQTVHRDDSGTHRTKGRVEILVLKSCRVFFDMAVGVDIAHTRYLRVA